MFPVGFFVTVWYKCIKIRICFIIIIIIIIINTIVLNSLIFWGWLFVTYGIDLVSIPRYYILVLYLSQNYGIDYRAIPIRILRRDHAPWRYFVNVLL